MLGSGRNRPYRLYPGAPDGYFLAGSNGLASGNHLIEAVNAGDLRTGRARCRRVVGRPADPRRAAAPSISPRSTMPIAAALLEKYDEAGIDVRAVEHHDRYRHRRVSLRDPRTAAGEPAAAAPLSRLRLPCRSGDRAGARPDRGGADPPDLYRRHSRRPVAGRIRGSRRDAEIADALLDALAREAGPTAFGDVAEICSQTIWAAICAGRWPAAAGGLGRVIAVDLTRPEFAVPVVRLVIPGLEWDPHHPNYRPGPRAPSRRQGR